MNTETVSGERRESTRKNGARIQALIMSRLAEVTQVRASACIGVDPSTVSRWVKDDLESICLLLASLGFQVSRTTSMVVDRDELKFMKRVVAKYFIAELEREED